MTDQKPMSGVPTTVTEAVFKPSEPMAAGSKVVKGIDFDDFAGRHVTVLDLVQHMDVMGFQAMNLSKAIKIVDEMVGRFSCLPPSD